MVDQMRILGMIFDRRLTWLPHLRDLKTACTRQIYLRVFSHLMGSRPHCSHPPVLLFDSVKVRLWLSIVLFSNSTPS